MFWSSKVISHAETIISTLTVLVMTRNLMKALIFCLDDYTTDQRGDVGSLVRIAAVDAVSTVLKNNLLNLSERQLFAAKVCGLAVEKLDKVRWRAWSCLESNWQVFAIGSRPSTSVLLFANHIIIMS